MRVRNKIKKLSRTKDVSIQCLQRRQERPKKAETVKNKNETNALFLSILLFGTSITSHNLNFLYFMYDAIFF